jgi:hypothetical protein
MPDDLDELIAAYPWARSLPADDQRRFAAELRQLITEWRHTAEVHADPDLLALLTAPVDD